ncbi:MarR family transcriptional regulator [Brevibacillus fluminis]|uniref:MarR family transcriptional regulator n=1 Tax=Brevibacillus fluminis TaxID=511487 RepID=A0A3M8DXV5_9BACL|nr:MarR family transcriptional regulator [Brevibacillus fluminis]
MDLHAIVKEMNEANYAMNVMILQEYQDALDTEITAKQTILLELVHKHTQLTVSEIAEKMKVSASAVSQIISKLEKAGYVRREINLQNRREILVRLDELGIQYFIKEEMVDRNVVERFYSQLDVEEVVTMKNIVLKLKGIVERELGRDKEAGGE